MSRWVRTDCDLLEHPLFRPEPFSEREAWLWLIIHAAWKDTRHRVGVEMVSVPRGSLFVTLRELQVAWKWVSDKRVRSFLNMLEKNAMIGRSADAGKTQITICNYSKYQDAGRSQDDELDAARTQAGRKPDALKIPEYQDTKDSSSLRSDSPRELALVHVDPPIEKPKREKAGVERPSDVPEPLWLDFQRHRKAKKAAITKTVIDGFRREAGMARVSMADAIRISIERNWQGFRASWLENEGARTRGSPGGRGSVFEAMRMIDAAQDHKPAGVTIDDTGREIDPPDRDGSLFSVPLIGRH